jgi:CheY-like chemotaxis protein
LLSRIFEPFFTTKPAGKGTGLGLSQVLGFAQQAGGAVTVDTKAGEGTEITLFLPRAESVGPAEGPGNGREQDAPAKLKQLRILVVDDDPAVSRLTVDMLEGAGHSATATTDARAALDLLEAGHRFDVLLSDIIMPGGMNGIDLARRVRARWPDLPVLLATGYAGQDSWLTSEFPMLEKPFTAIELGHAMAAAVRLSTMPA